MLKQFLLLLVAATALAVPAAALADDPPVAPQPSTQGQPSGDRAGQSGGPAARLRKVHRRLHMLVKRCRHTQGAEREACLRKLLTVLDQVKAKLDEVEAKIKERCAAADAPTRCARADKLIQRLENLKARIDRLEAKIKEHLGSGPGDSGSADSGSSSSDVDSVASLDSALAAVEQQQP